MDKRAWKKWGVEELDFLKNNYIELGAKKCKEVLVGRSAETIKEKAVKMGFARKLFKSNKERFESKFIVTPGCWIWIPPMSTNKYGQFTVGDNKYSAHRYSYELYISKIPDNLHVCHTCDNRLCVNPDHFFLGTTQDNTNDRIKKKRSAKGEMIASSILTEELVIDIINSNEKHKILAKKYNVSTYTISDIKLRKTWKHITLPEEK